MTGAFGRKEIQAVTDLDLRIRIGEIVAVVGAILGINGMAGVTLAPSSPLWA